MFINFFTIIIIKLDPNKVSSMKKVIFITLVLVITSVLCAKIVEKEKFDDGDADTVVVKGTGSCIKI